MTNLKATFHNLFIEKTDSTSLQFFRYIFVGGIAFVADGATLFVLTELGLHYLLSAAVAFLVGLIVNFSLSKLLIFTKASKVTTPLGEFVTFGMIGLIGLGLTELLMYLFTDVIGFYYMLSKVVSSVIVLGWNFIARKLTLYRN